MKPQVEICTGSYEDCLAAAKGGAKRVELNSALSVGGLTPSTATLKRVKQDTDLEVICMVRPRAAGFAYNEQEFQIMLAEAQELLAAGADGIAFGFLTPEGTVDAEKTAAMVNLIHQAGKTAVFHRAIDVVKDLDQAMAALCQLGIDRVLTSGQQAKAYDGMAVIADLQKKFGSQIEILAGSGVNAANAWEILNRTGISQVHSSCKDYAQDPTTAGAFVNYSYLPDPCAYDIVSASKVQELVIAAGA